MMMTEIDYKWIARETGNYLAAHQNITRSEATLIQDFSEFLQMQSMESSKVDFNSNFF